MPLGVEEAKRSLNLLWEVKEAALEEGRDTSAVNRAISMLHSYVTEIQPRTQLSVWDHYRWGAADGLRTARSSAFGPLHVVELICSATEKLGIYLDTVSVFSHDVHSSHGFPPRVISLVKPLSTAERSGELAIGDQVLEINGHSLAQVSLQKARLGTKLCGVCVRVCVCRLMINSASSPSSSSMLVGGCLRALTARERSSL